MAGLRRLSYLFARVLRGLSMFNFQFQNEYKKLTLLEENRYLEV